MVNHNKLLKRYDGCIGVKTGYTDKSGRCLVSAAKRDGVLLIAVTLDAPDDWNDHTAMLDFAFPLYNAYEIEDYTETNRNIPVIGGAADTVPIGLPGDKRQFVTSSEDKVKFRVTIKQYAVAPIKRGDVLGCVEIIINDKLAETYNYVSLADCDKARFNIFDLFRRG